MGMVLHSVTPCAEGCSRKFHKETKATAVMSLHGDIKGIEIISLKPCDAVLNHEGYVTV